MRKLNRPIRRKDLRGNLQIVRAPRRRAPVIALIAGAILVVTIVAVGLAIRHNEPGAITPAATSPAFTSPVATMPESASHDLPDPQVTPGAADPRVTEANIGSTICVPGYTRSVRPPEEYTYGLKRQQLDDPSRDYTDRNARDFEEDHLIPLEIGGSPTDARNLWPEHWADPWGARTKDLVENELHRRVCLPTDDPDRLSLEQAQHAIAESWTSAYQRYVVR